MKLIAILIALAALKYLPWCQSTTRYTWFQSYANKLQGWVGGTGSAWVSCIAIVLPLLIAITIVQAIFSSWVWGVLGFCISVVALWYCLWPVPLEQLLAKVAPSTETDEEKAKDETVVAEVPAKTEIKQHSAEASRSLSEELLTRANEKTFSVLFWFIVLGAFGAILYRSVSLLRNNAQCKESPLASVAPAAQTVQELLDWIPARITAFTYMLAGDFTAGFTEWVKDIWSGWTANATVLIRTGLAACSFNLDDSSEADDEENRSLLRMIDRALIVWLVLIAIFTLGAWIY